MRRATVILFTAIILILLASNTFTAKAANDGEIAMAYCQSDNLYAYVSLPSGCEAADLTAQARIGNEQFDIIEPKLQRVSDNSTPVSYVFMIDISTSMPKYKENINKFIDGIVNSTQGNASYLVTTFGEKFDVIGDFTDNKQKVIETVKAIQYNANQTSLYTGILQAVDFFNQKERAAGEIYNLVIISDGIEYDKNGPTQSEVQEQILQATPILIHTFGLCTQKTEEAEIKASDEALKVLGAFSRVTSGIHTTFGRDELTEEQLAGQITDYINNLYLAQFNLFMYTSKNNSFDLGLLFSPIGDTGKMFRLEKSNVPYLQQEGSVDVSSGNENEISSDDETGGEAQDGSGNSSEDEAIRGTEDGTGSGSGDEAVRDTEDGTDNGTEDEATKTSGGTDRVVDKQAAKNPELFGINLYLMGGILAAILLLLAATIYFLTRKKSVPISNENNDIFMKLEVISGKCRTKKMELFLAEEFIVGRNKKCDISFKSKDVSSKNSRIFVRDNVIYVEDLNSINGTAISGMKIHAPNRLRSGDEISIGSVKFKLKF